MTPDNFDREELGKILGIIQRTYPSIHKWASKVIEEGISQLEGYSELKGKKLSELFQSPHITHIPVGKKEHYLKPWIKDYFLLYFQL